MDKFFRRSMNKKGFTMIELIIVLAIIAVLAAMVVPNLFASDIPTKAKGYAKSYFYTAQEFFSRQRIADNALDPSLPPLMNNFYLYTTVDAFGRPSESGIVDTTKTVMTSATDFQTGGAIAGFKRLVADFENYMEKNLSECDHQGTYYLVLDNEFRVQVSYWSEGSISDLRTASTDLEFSDDNIISGYWCCAFPAEMSTVSGVSNRKMFHYVY